MTSRAQAEQEEGYVQPTNEPTGYTEAGSDLVGFWDPEANAIHCIPRTAKRMDNSIEPKKESILITVELVEDCKVLSAEKDAEGEVILAKKGSLVGVWYKPGMKAIGNTAGIPIYMHAAGLKDTGKPNPMQLFRILKKGDGTKLPIVGDFRKQSLPAGAKPTTTVDDDIPF